MCFNSAQALKHVTTIARELTRESAQDQTLDNLLISYIGYLEG